MYILNLIQQGQQFFIQSDNQSAYHPLLARLQDRAGNRAMATCLGNCNICINYNSDDIQSYPRSVSKGGSRGIELLAADAHRWLATPIISRRT
jgi:hypothetical protein